MKNTYAISILLAAIVVIISSIYGFVDTPPALFSVTSTTTPVVMLPNDEEEKPVVQGSNYISIGEKRTFGDVTLTPIKIIEDSRCPVDVNCFWAGRIVVETLVTVNQNTATLEISSIEPTVYAGYKISVGARTSPVLAQKKLDPADYHLVFTIEKILTATKPSVSDPKGGCYVGGCSSQLCSDSKDMMSTCEYNDSYACYQGAKCERQADGKCGWSDTAALRSCLSSKS